MTTEHSSVRDEFTTFSAQRLQPQAAQHNNVFPTKNPFIFPSSLRESMLLFKMADCLPHSDQHSRLASRFPCTPRSVEVNPVPTTTFLLRQQFCLIPNYGFQSRFQPHSKHRFPAPFLDEGCRKPVLGVWDSASLSKNVQ